LRNCERWTGSPSCRTWCTTWRSSSPSVRRPLTSALRKIPPRPFGRLATELNPFRIVWSCSIQALMKSGEIPRVPPRRYSSWHCYIALFAPACVVGHVSILYARVSLLFLFWASPPPQTTFHVKSLNVRLSCRPVPFAEQNGASVAQPPDQQDISKVWTGPPPPAITAARAIYLPHHYLQILHCTLCTLCSPPTSHGDT